MVKQKRYFTATIVQQYYCAPSSSHLMFIPLINSSIPFWYHSTAFSLASQFPDKKDMKDFKFV